MIRVERKILDAACDGCQKPLIVKMAGQEIANFGFMKSGFGAGSPLNDRGNPEEFHLCELCWVKALTAVGLQPTH